MNNSDILKALAKGINPISGELISDDNILSDPTIIRALFSAVDAMKSGNTVHFGGINNSRDVRKTSNNTTREDNNIKNGLPKNNGNPWDLNSKEELVNRFKNGSSALDLAKYFERGIGSINAILLEKNLIAKESLPVRSRPTVRQIQEINIRLDRPENYGLPWNNNDVNELVKKFKNGSTLAELSKFYERSESAIEKNLANKGLKTEVQDHKRKLKNRQSNLPNNHGKPWSGILKKELFNKYISGSSIADLATHFERTKGSIAGTLFDKGLISNDELDCIIGGQNSPSTNQILNKPNTEPSAPSKTIKKSIENEVHQEVDSDPNFPFKL